MTEASDGPRVLLCTCEGSMPVDHRAVGRGLGRPLAEPAHQLCGTDIETLRRQFGADEVVVACTAMRALFDEEAGAAGHKAGLVFANLRETAGWSGEARAAAPKMAALLAGAAVPMPETALIPYTSQGVALVLGQSEAAFRLASRLTASLDLTILLDRPGAAVLPPASAEIPVLRGSVVKAKGHLGAFELTIDDYALPSPSSRGSFRWGPSMDGAVSRCDLVLDVTGKPGLFGQVARPGYLRADPADAAAVERLAAEAAGLVGGFDKPRFVQFDAGLCAHSRNRKQGCTRCLDVCPADAITSAGDTVAIDTNVCAGCGGCAVVCPTGAASYALPPSDALLRRVRAMLRAYLAAGGLRPVLLFHDAEGEAWIDRLARRGAGLPARVIPVRVNEVTALSPELPIGALAMGAAEVRVLVAKPGAHGVATLERGLGLASTLAEGMGMGAARVQVLAPRDAAGFADSLGKLPARAGVASPDPLLPLGARRGVLLDMARALGRATEAPEAPIALPEGAPFGRVVVDTQGCTLCLACVSACPTGALGDNPDRPMLRFTESACVQCGLCAATCPEQVITLEPRFVPGVGTDAARVVKEEEPALCTRCGTAFGTASSIKRVRAKLAASHWMFQGSTERLALLELCGDCRPIVATEAEFDPYAGAARPRPRTAEDYATEDPEAG